MTRARNEPSSDIAGTIMVVEDDETLMLGLEQALRHAGFEVRTFDRGETALAAALQSPPDLLLLDVMLPGMDGLTVLRRFKSQYPKNPVILLTARTSESDRVEGLELGADDYVPKPFSIRELIARIRARLRAGNALQRVPETIVVGDAKVDLRRRIVQSAGDEIRLTTHEAGVLRYLVAHQGRDVTREELLERVWGYSPTMQTRTVDNQILKLRKKLEPTPAEPRHILTVHGVGYRFEP